MNILLSFIIIEYHCINEIISCIDSIESKVKLSYEIIVSSNSCYSKGEKESIPHLHKNVHWIFNEKNGGYAYAMNRGLEHADGKYLIIMNSDCILVNEITAMVNFLDQHKEVGAIAPQIIDADGKIQDTVRPYITPRRFIIRQIRRLFSKNTCVLNRHFDYNKVQTTDWAIGAFLMVSRKTYEKTKGLDEKIFMYAEDAEWCTRIRKYGFEIVYYPKVQIRYKGTRRARNNIKYALIFLKSHLHYWHKWGFFHGYPNRKKIIFE